MVEALNTSKAFNTRKQTYTTSNMTFERREGKMMTNCITETGLRSPDDLV
jgi:hypothetical protein